MKHQVVFLPLIAVVFLAVWIMMAQACSVPQQTKRSTHREDVAQAVVDSQQYHMKQK